MKITYNNTSSPKLKASVTHNGTVHEIKSGDTLELAVKQGDAVSYKVGALTKERPLHFQQRNAEFEIMPNKRLQLLLMVGLLAFILMMWFYRNIGNAWLTVIVVALVGIYEAVRYFAGYVAVSVHGGH